MTAQRSSRTPPSSPPPRHEHAHDGSCRVEHAHDNIKTTRQTLNASSDLDAIAESYQQEGCVFPVTGIFKVHELSQIEELCYLLVENRPENLAAEDLMNLHTTIPAVHHALCSHPVVVGLAKRLLGLDEKESLTIFTSRILCKEPRTGKEIDWHQDALYWPLRQEVLAVDEDEIPVKESPPSGEHISSPSAAGAADIAPPAAGRPADSMKIPARTTVGTATGGTRGNSPRSAGCRPHVVSLWLALDDITPQNGPMDVLPFSAQPETRNDFVPRDFVLDSGGSTEDFSNFNLSLNKDKLTGAEQARRVLLKKGEAEFHSAWTVHRSDPNRSEDQRRMAWIVRYCPANTRVVAGVREAFGSDYTMVPVVAGGETNRLLQATITKLRAGLSEAERAAWYRPCFGSAVAMLKK